VTENKSMRVSHIPLTFPIFRPVYIAQTPRVAPGGVKIKLAPNEFAMVN